MTRYTAPGTYSSEWVARTRQLLGKRVRAHYNVPPEDHQPPAVIGTFVSFTDDGEFDIVGEDGMTAYCWPLGHIEEI
jgi:hypothetical protein